MMQSAEFPEVQSLTSDELLVLLSDETAFESFFASLAAVKHHQAINADIQRGNEEMAAANLSMKTEIKSLEEEITDLANVAQLQRQELDAKLARKQQLMERHSPEALHRLLSAATQQAEQLSDATADAFHAGRMDLKQFITDYTEQRRTFHLRREKLEAFYGRFGPGSALSSA